MFEILKGSVMVAYQNNAYYQTMYNTIQSFFICGGKWCPSTLQQLK